MMIVSVMMMVMFQQTIFRTCLWLIRISSRTFLAHSALVLNKNIQLCKYSVAIEIYFDKYKHSFWQLLNFRSHGLSVID